MKKNQNIIKQEALTITEFRKGLASMEKSLESKFEKKFVTVSVFESSMASIARSFDSINERLHAHDRMLELLIQEMRAIHEDNKYVKATLSSFIHSITIHDHKMGDLETRVEKLEEKVFA